MLEQSEPHTAPAWHGFGVVTFNGQFDTHIKTGEDYAVLSLADLFALEPTRAPKGAGPAIIPSLYHDFDAREHAVQRAQGRFVALCGDVDSGDHALDAIRAAVTAFAPRTAAMIYASAHARPGDMRWRILIPLAEPQGFDLWHDAQCAFFAFMEARGIAMDHALTRAAQPVYLPNVPDQHGKSGTALRGEDGAPLFYRCVKTPLAWPGMDLSAGAVAEGIAAIRARRIEDERERERIRREAEQRRATMPRGEGASLMDDFNAENSVAAMLEMCGYEQSPRHGEDWRSPYQTSESYATRIIGSKWVSLSASDAAAGLGTRCQAGCYGDAYDLFVHFKHGGDHKAAYRALGAERRASNVIYPRQFETPPVPEWMVEAPQYDDYPEWAGDVEPVMDEPVIELEQNTPDLLPFFDAGDFEGRTVTQREWMMDGWEPRRSCVYLTGQGAVGKSLFTQQRMTCAAVGKPMLGVNIEPGVAVYVTCEDDLAEMHRRQDSINKALGISWDDLRGRLFLISLKGMLNKELCTFDIEDRMRTTERWTSLNATIDHLGATHVALDNVAHFFTGNENIRNQVAAFVGMIDGMAERINGVVLLLGHPNKAGSEYSGSTAWENQVRARLFLGMDQTDEGVVMDPDARVLTNSKPNYGKRGDALRFRWHQWAFVREEDMPRDVRGELAAVIASNGAEEAFLRCLRARSGQAGREVGPKPGPSYAPTRFAEMGEAKGYGKAALAGAMERLLARGIIVTEETFNNKNKRYATIIREVQ